MDRKKWTRVLIVVVAGLWAYNIYRTVENYQVKNEVREERANEPMVSVPILFNKDTFDLELPSDDPFLRGQSGWENRTSFTAASTDNSDRKIHENSSPDNPPELQNWPTIKYFGFLRRIQENHQLCILNIDGQNHRMAVGEKKGGIEIVRAYPDSVVVLFNNERKAFKK